MKRARSPPFPPGWDRWYTAEGRPYYFNEDSGERQWHDPRHFGPSPPPAYQAHAQATPTTQQTTPQQTDDGVLFGGGFVQTPAHETNSSQIKTEPAQQQNFVQVQPVQQPTQQHTPPLLYPKSQEATLAQQPVVAPQHQILSKYQPTTSPHADTLISLSTPTPPASTQEQNSNKAIIVVAEALNAGGNVDEILVKELTDLANAGVIRPGELDRDCLKLLCKAPPAVAVAALKRATAIGRHLVKNLNAAVVAAIKSESRERAQEKHCQERHVGLASASPYDVLEPDVARALQEIEASGLLKTGLDAGAIKMLGSRRSGEAHIVLSHFKKRLVDAEETTRVVNPSAVLVSLITNLPKLLEKELEKMR